MSLFGKLTKSRSKSRADGPRQAGRDLRAWNPNAPPAEARADNPAARAPGDRAGTRRARACGSRAGNPAKWALTVAVRNLTSWVLLVAVGLAARTAMCPGPRAPLSIAAAKPSAVSIAVKECAAPADNAVSGAGPAAAGAAHLEDASPVADAAPAPESSATSRAKHNRSCRRDVTLRASIASYCRAGAFDLGLCCASDDGFCSSYLGGRCDSYEDNDCRVFDVLLKTHEFLLSRKTLEQYTPDPRRSAFTSQGEYFRLVPCMQAQGYLNLYSATGDELFLKEALDRLDFIAAHLDQALTQTPYDGQLGWAFLDAYRVTCDKRYLEIGLKVAGTSEPNASHVLNWGVLEAMNLLRAHEVTGEESQVAEAAVIVNETLGYQNPDGSFPHQAHRGARSLPYTSWLARDLSVYAKSETAPEGLAAALDRAAALLEQQLSADGSPRYQGDSLVAVRVVDPVCLRCVRSGSAGCADYCADICPGEPELLPCSCITDPERQCPRVDALVNISYYDDGDSEYDVRGWTSELPATAAVLDVTGRLEAKWSVLRFLFGLQNSDGSFPDKWGFFLRPEDGMYVFGSEEHSVIRTSSVFYYLSGLLRPPEVIRRGPEHLVSREEDASEGDAAPARIGDGSAYAAASLSDVSNGAANAAAKEVVDASVDATANVTVDASAAASASTDAASVGVLSEGEGESSARIEQSPLRGSPGLRLLVRPNPSFGAVSIGYDAGTTPCLIQILDVSGRLVTELAPCANQGAEVLWNGRDSAGNRVPPGVYFVRVAIDGETGTTKLILLRPEGLS